MRMRVCTVSDVQVIHFKRFQYVCNRWVKSSKMVVFPRDDFDPTKYVESKHIEVPEHSSLMGDDDQTFHTSQTAEQQQSHHDNTRRDSNGRLRTESTTSVVPMWEPNFHRLKEGFDQGDLKYDLYSLAVRLFSPLLSSTVYSTLRPFTVSLWSPRRWPLCLLREESKREMVFVQRQSMQGTVPLLYLSNPVFPFFPFSTFIRFFSFEGSGSE